jgi:hypothetical protein
MCTSLQMPNLANDSKLFTIISDGMKHIVMCMTYCIHIFKTFFIVVFGGFNLKTFKVVYVT